jgi:tetratricopeptide (TPR) repeat protein
MIPGETSWVVIFSRNSTSWGSFSYDPAEDALRVTVTPRAVEPREILGFEFVDPAPRSTVVTMRWEKVEVPFRVEVAPELAAQNLRNQLRGRAQSEWQAWAEVANYLLENNLSAGEALQDAEQAVAIDDRFESEITKARALDALGRHDEALAARNTALGMGTERQVYDFGRGLQRLNQQEPALEVFRNNIIKHPGTVIAHNEAARIAAAKGDYDTAVKEMKLAISVAPERSRGNLRDLLRQLENGVDINK